MGTGIPKGVFDIVPASYLKDSERWRSSELWCFVEETIRRVATSFSFSEIRTPMFERTELFERGVGEGTDIVSKEMYTFEDKGKRSLSLRPEGTAPVVRAFIDGRLDQALPEHKLFYIGPMFRYERPQAGRYRQHHQFGAEAIGNKSPEQDVEIIDLLYTTYSEIGLKDLHVSLNSIGGKTCRTNYREALIKYLQPQVGDLSEDSQKRLESNPLRILDSKDKGDQAILEGAPCILDFLDDEKKAHFDRVQKILSSIGIPFQVEPKLVRGLDYYNNTVFEVAAGELGAQNSVGGGGRYDGLLKSLGGPDLPAFGFGSGIERIIQTLIAQEATPAQNEGPLLFLIPLGEAALSKGMTIVHQLRKHGIRSQVDLSGRKLKKVMNYANSIHAQFTAVLGDDDLAAGQVKLKEMLTGESFPVDIDNLVGEMLVLLAGRRQDSMEDLAKDLEELLGAESLKQHKLTVIKDANTQ